MFIFDELGQEIPSKYYTNTAYKDDTSVSELKAGEEYTLKVEANSKYKNYCVGSFELDGVSIGTEFKAKVKLDGSAKKLKYDGEPFVIEDVLDDKGYNLFENGSIKVTVDGQTVIYGVDYIVARCEDNNNKGNMRVYLKGIGKYSGAIRYRSIKLN